MSLYENINKKRRSGRKMRNKGDKGAPTEQDFANAAKTAKMKRGDKVKKSGSLKDHSGDGKITRKDYLMQIGVFDKPKDMGHGGNVCSNRKKMMYGGGAKAYSTENKRYGGGVPNPRMPDPMD